VIYYLSHVQQVTEKVETATAAPNSLRKKLHRQPDIGKGTISVVPQLRQNHGRL
jgi:hypothetical protein